MSIAKIHPSTPLDPKPNRDFATDNRLSYTARGMLAHIMATPEELTRDQMQAHGLISRRDCAKSLRELESLGYLKRIQERTQKGGWGEIKYKHISGNFFSIPDETLTDFASKQAHRSTGIGQPDQKRSTGVFPPECGFGIDSSEITRSTDSGTTAGHSVISREESHTGEEEMPDSLFGGSSSKKSKNFPAPVIEKIYQAYPRHVARADALKAIGKALLVIADRKEAPEASADPAAWLLARVQAFSASDAGELGEYTPYPATWFNAGRYDDDQKTWERTNKALDPKTVARRAGEIGGGVLQLKNVRIM